jgi:predicted GNAT family N-acyltransferase
MKITFKVIDYGSAEYKKAVTLREEILRKPLGLTFRPEELKKEEDHIHIGGIENDEVLATAVLVPEGEICKMQRVVVKSDLQSSGIGTQMMKFCEEEAGKREFSKIYCHARDTAVPFYLKNGYSPEGEYFEEDTIPHLQMGKSLEV